MPKFEQFGQTKNPEEPKVSESSMESREQFGGRALQAAQEVYADEVQALEKKVSEYKSFKTFVDALIIPGGLYIIGTFLGVDIEKMTGLNISESADAAIRLSWAISMLGAGSVGLVQAHFEKKLNYLKEKFGVLSKSEDKETE